MFCKRIVIVERECTIFYSLSLSLSPSHVKYSHSNTSLIYEQIYSMNYIMYIYILFMPQIDVPDTICGAIIAQKSYAWMIIADISAWMQRQFKRAVRNIILLVTKFLIMTINAHTKHQNCVRRYFLWKTK